MYSAAILPFCRLLMVALVWALMPPPATAETLWGTVSNVIDGDTVTLSNGTRVRYIGINTPETRRKVRGKWMFDPQPFAVAATRANRQLVAQRRVRLETDRETTDRYGRLLAYVYVDNIMVNEQLVRKGLARARAYPPNTRHQATLAAAQRAAQQQRLGIWGDR